VMACGWCVDGVWIVWMVCGLCGWCGWCVDHGILYINSIHKMRIFMSPWCGWCVSCQCDGRGECQWATAELVQASTVYINAH
jgi:hypothetical protein